MIVRSTNLLSKLYGRVTAISAFPLALLIIILGLHHYAEQRDRKLEGLRAAIGECHLALEELTSAAATHVGQMQQWAGNFLQAYAGEPSPLMALLSVEADSDTGRLTGYFLEKDVNPLLPDSTGNFLGTSTALSGRWGNLRDVGLALEIFAVQQLGHAAEPAFRWSYLLGAERRFLSIYPASDRAVFGEPGRDASDTVAGIFTRAVFRDGGPARNPAGEPFWTAVDFDIIGDVPVVSRAAPIYWNGQFIGVAGTDIPLAALHAILALPAGQEGTAWLVDAEGRVLAATRSGAADTADAVHPADFGALAPEDAGRFVWRNGHYVLHLPMAQAPWRLVYGISGRELSAALLPRFVPYGVILLGLVATLVLSYLLVRQQFVRPMVALTQYVRLSARGTEVPPPRLPRIWKPWLSVLNATFQRNRSYLKRLQDSEDRYRRLVELSPDGVMLHDRSGIIFLNPAGCAILGFIDPAEVLGRHYIDFVCDDERESAAARMTSVLDGGDHIPLEERLVCTADGRRVHIEVTAMPFGKPDSGTALAIFRDISKRKTAEEQLRHSEEQFRAIAEAVPVPIVIARREDHKVVFANRQCRHMFGMTEDDELGVDTLQFFNNPADRERILGVLERYGAIANREVMLKRIDGSAFPALVSVAPMIHHGEPATLTGVIDVSALKAAEQSLRDSEALKSAIIDAAMDCIVAIDESGRIIEFSPAAERTFGRRRSDMLGQVLGETLVPSHLAAHHDNGLARYLADGDSRIIGRRLETEALRADGSAFPIELAINETIQSGRLIFTASIRDITERRQMEQALRDSEQRFRMITESYPVPVVITRQADGLFLYANPAARDLLRIPPDGINRMSSAEIYEDPRARQVLLQRLQREGRVDGFESRFRLMDGTRIWGRVTVAPMMFGGEQALISAIVDLTERMEAEAELARQREALHQKEKITALGSLLAGVAHELNNPLSVVVGQSMILEELADDPAITARARRICSAAERCNRIVKSFLAMARSKAPSRRPVSINRTIEAALEIVAYGLRSAGIEVVLDLDPDLPEPWADGDQLHQVLTNLIVNAQQAMKAMDGPRRLDIRTAFDAAVRQIVIEVQDAGPGIPEEVAERIFDPFFTTKPEGMGTGIGLSVCRDIITSHGGEINFMTAPGGGMTFVVRLPLGESERQAEAAPEASAVAGGCATVLVVDDEQDIAQTLADMLRVSGHQVEIASSGRVALDHIAGAGSHYDLIFSDIRMPEMDGPMFFRALRAERPDLAARLIFMTGDTLGTDVAGLIRETGAPVIEKPFDPAIVADVVATKLGGGNRG